MISNVQHASRRGTDRGVGRFSESDAGKMRQAGICAMSDLGSSHVSAMMAFGGYKVSLTTHFTMTPASRPS